MIKTLTLRVTIQDDLYVEWSLLLHDNNSSHKKKRWANGGRNLRNWIVFHACTIQIDIRSALQLCNWRHYKLSTNEPVVEKEVRTSFLSFKLMDEIEQRFISFTMTPPTLPKYGRDSLPTWREGKSIHQIQFLMRFHRIESTTFLISVADGNNFMKYSNGNQIQLFLLEQKQLLHDSI